MIEIVVTQDNQWLSRLGRWLGLCEYNHALLRYRATVVPTIHLPPQFAEKMKGALAGLDLTYEANYIIEAGFSGVVERPWHPEEYTNYAVLRLKEPYSEAGYKRMLAFARTQVGERYGWELLPPIIIRLLRKLIGNFLQRPDALFVLGIASADWLDSEICTSVVDKTFCFGGYDLVPSQRSALVTADEIYASPILEVVSESHQD